LRSGFGRRPALAGAANAAYHAKNSVFVNNRRNKYWAVNRALVLLPALQAPANSGAQALRIDFPCDFSRTPIDYFPPALTFLP
jgi:hypothetical protein